MKDLEFASTQSSPAINANWQSGVLAMRGDSYPENSFEFFSPIISWIEEYLEGTDQPLRLRLNLLYLNTSSVKAMMDILELLEQAHLRGRNVAVKWNYDKENARIADLAEEFKEDCTFPFDILSNENDAA